MPQSPLGVSEAAANNYKKSALNITNSTVVSPKLGYIYRAISNGTASLYDSNTTLNLMASQFIGNITSGISSVEFPVKNGVTVVPTGGAVVAVAYQ